MQSSSSPWPPLTALKGVGPAVVERLAHLNIFTVEALLFHLPLRYEDRTRVWAVRDLRPGLAALFEGEVVAAEIKFGKRRMLHVLVCDGEAEIALRYFHFTLRQKERFKSGSKVRCFGEVRLGAQGLEVVHPDTQLLAERVTPLDGHLTAVYSVAEGVTQGLLRRLVAQALNLLSSATTAATPLAELLPEPWPTQGGYPSLAEALRLLHRPPVDISLAAINAMTHPAQQRLIFEELLAHHLSLRKLRLTKERATAPVLRAKTALIEPLLAALPFQLTSAQQRVCAEIHHDLQQGYPMQRLLQGDVGSGKTLVAVMAMLRAVEAGYQAAIMAPTELLAEQHLATIGRWLSSLAIEVAWLGGGLNKKGRDAALTQIASGSAAVVVGTHALFQSEVTFDRLGLVVIDEQHRFGVHQRYALREKGARAGCYPHQLIMTATPIPRTLAMTAYADLDLSVIDELPPGRQPIDTVVLSDARRAAVMERIQQACSAGRQAYWVCTLIEESEVLQCQAATDTAQWLTGVLPTLRIGLVHGRMKSAEKELVMNAFRNGEIDLLVATTVIEVGVDVPRATLMVIENAERLGLAQLHQLRGRVGRGAEKSACVLMYRSPLSALAKQRLGVMRDTNDGFEIARHDMAIRGPGEVLGTRQSGEMRFRIADIVRDQAHIAEVDRVAQWLLTHHPDHVEPLIRRWVGTAGGYGSV